MTRPNRYIWLGTNKLYDAFTFAFEKTEHGWFQAHVYKFDDEHLDLHRRDARRTSGARTASTRPTRTQSIAFCEKLFADNLRRRAR